jgi:hypothetical protein
VVSRYFVRCTLCLAVSAIDEHPASVMQCGLCAGTLETMGRVERDRLVRDELLCPCDDRCTSARGPVCTCKCNGKNHGSHLLVCVTRDAGKVPTVTPALGREQARINADEYRAARTAVLAILDTLRARKAATGWLDAADYRQLRALQAANRKAHEARDHRARMKTLRAVLPSTWTHAPARSEWTPRASTPQATNQPALF